VNSPESSEMACTHTDTNSRAGSFYEDENARRRKNVGLFSSSSPKLQTCNEILYQVGRILWGGE